MHAVRVERPAALAGPPDMWDRDHLAIYAHYACVGCVSGLLANSLLPYCLYVAHGEPNTCATKSEIRMLGPAKKSRAHHAQVRDDRYVRQPTVGI